MPAKKSPTKKAGEQVLIGAHTKGGLKGAVAHALEIGAQPNLDLYRFARDMERPEPAE